MRLVQGVMLCLCLIAACARPDPVSIPAPAQTAPSIDVGAPAPAGPSPARVPQPAPVPVELARQQAECQDSGGQMLRLGARLVCQRPTPDAGQSCRQASDCTGGCLARAQVCAPVTPLFGCQDLLTAPGRVERLCRE